MKIKRLLIPGILALLIAPGCVTRTTVINEPRQSVHFASQQAAETFYNAYLAIYYPSNKTNSVAVWIGLPFYQHLKNSTDNVRFNAAVQSADSNHDGIISDAEAQAYAAKELPVVPPPSPALTGTSQVEIQSLSGEFKPAAPVKVRLLLDKAKIDFPQAPASSPANAVIAWGKQVDGLTVGISCETTTTDSRKLPKIFFYVANNGDTEIPGVILRGPECIVTLNGQYFAQRSWGGKSSAMPPGRKYGPIAIATDELRQIPKLRAWPVPAMDQTAPCPELREGTNTLRVDYIRDHLLTASGEIQIVAK